MSRVLYTADPFPFDGPDGPDRLSGIVARDTDSGPEVVIELTAIPPFGSRAGVNAFLSWLHSSVAAAARAAWPSQTPGTAADTAPPPARVVPREPGVPAPGELEEAHRRYLEAELLHLQAEYRDMIEVALRIGVTAAPAPDVLRRLDPDAAAEIDRLRAEHRRLADPFLWTVRWYADRQEPISLGSHGELILRDQTEGRLILSHPDLAEPFPPSAGARDADAERDRARDMVIALEAENTHLRAALERIRDGGEATAAEEQVAWFRAPVLCHACAGAVIATAVLLRTDPTHPSENPPAHDR
jgi:hypothetical protein